jgi:hypothetical protein
MLKQYRYVECCYAEFAYPEFLNAYSRMLQLSPLCWQSLWVSSLSPLCSTMTPRIVTFSIMTFSIMTFSIMTFSIHDSQHKWHSISTLYHYAKSHYADCHILFVVMLNVNMLNVTASFWSLGGYFKWLTLIFEAIYLKIHYF